MAKKTIQSVRDFLESDLCFDGLTERQSEVLRYVLQCWASGFIPTVREIGAELGIGTTNGVVCHLTVLRKKGYVEETDNTGLMLADKSLELVL